MAYLIGEVEQLTGIKPYVLRYWESVMPGFAPQKDSHGRRIYTQREIDIISRLKFLIYEKRFTIDGARKQLIHETELMDRATSGIEAIHKMRETLGTLYLELKTKRENRGVLENKNEKN